MARRPDPEHFRVRLAVLRLVPAAAEERPLLCLFLRARTVAWHLHHVCAHRNPLPTRAPKRLGTSETKLATT